MAISPEDFLKKANEMRAEKSLNPFKWDDRLAKAAQEHADLLAAGRAHPHQDLEGRITRAGWKIDNWNCLVSRRSMQANYTEGVVEGSMPLSTDFLGYLVSSGPGEPHYDDFYDPLINHVGVGFASGNLNWVVLDYGRICQEDPEPDPELTIDDFSSL